MGINFLLQSKHISKNGMDLPLRRNLHKVISIAPQPCHFNGKTFADFLSALRFLCVWIIPHPFFLSTEKNDYANELDEKSEETASNSAQQKLLKNKTGTLQENITEEENRNPEVAVRQNCMQNALNSTRMFLWGRRRGRTIFEMKTTKNFAVIKCSAQ